jgi:DNA-binding transcriptional regulator LsrR (DeoR family)
VYSAGYLEPEDIQVLDTEEVVGDVCTVFLREDGTYADIPLNKRATGPSPLQLRQIPRRVCVVSGDNKIVPLRAALRAGVITDLIIDEVTATTFMVEAD